MDLKINHKLYIRALTFLPPLLGIVIFTYIVKYSGYEAVPKRIPLYQGTTAYFSLLLLGFTYINNRHNIWGSKIIPLLIFITIFPTVFYTYNGLDIILTILFILIQFFTAIISYMTIIKGNMHKYLILGCFNSIVLPFSLALNELFLFLICISLFIYLLYIILSLRHILGSFNYSENGLNIIKSIFLQSPLIILPFFDFKIAELIGVERYSNYVLLYKYIYGSIVLLFSYKQLNLTFSYNLSKIHLIIYQLIAVLFLLIICFSFEHYFIFALSIALLSYGINLNSLLIRKALLDGITFNHSLIGLGSVFLYILMIYGFGEFLTITSSAFIAFMFIASFIPAMYITTINRNINPTTQNIDID